MKVLIAFATLLEAQNTICLLRAIEITKNELFQFDQGSILITGMGSIAAASKTMQYLKHCDQVWNLGIAGALKQASLGDLFEIQSVSQWLSLPTDIHAYSKHFAEQIHPKLSIHEHGAHLLSSNYPIHCEKLKKSLSNYDLIDMEGYGIAYTAKQLKKPCKILKIVSDFVSENGHKTIQEQICHLSYLLAQKTEKLVNQI